MIYYIIPLLFAKLYSLLLYIVNVILFPYVVLLWYWCFINELNCKINNNNKIKWRLFYFSKILSLQNIKKIVSVHRLSYFSMIYIVIPSCNYRNIWFICMNLISSTLGTFILFLKANFLGFHVTHKHWKFCLFHFSSLI